MGYPLKKILTSLPPGPRLPHFHRHGGAPGPDLGLDLYLDKHDTLLDAFPVIYSQYDALIADE